MINSLDKNFALNLDTDYTYGICENCGNEAYLINGLCESCYLESLEETNYSIEEMVGNSYCLMCHEIMNGYSSNEKIINSLQEFLKKKGNFEEEIEELEKIKRLPICRWDLWQLLANILGKKDKSLANYFKKKITSYYDFHWVIATF